MTNYEENSPPGLLARALAALAAASHRRPWWTMSLVVVTALVALGAARNLTVNSDLVSLLPPGFASVQGLERYKARGGSVGYVAVIARSESQEDLLEFAREVSPRLSALPTVDYVEYVRPSSYFEDRLLYYLEVGELEEFAEQIEDRANWERRQANPLLVDLEGSGPPEVSMQIDAGRLPRGMAARPEGTPYYLSADKRCLVMLVKPTLLASDLTFARKVVADVEGVLASVGPAAGVTHELGGRFTKRVQQQVMLQRDLGLTSTVALLLIVLYLGLHFRRVGGVLLTLAPLAIGLTWTFGATAFVFGELNILTAFVGAILLGLGIDHGLHLLERYAAGRAAGASPEDAVTMAFSSTGRAVLLAAMTTALGFAGLAVSDFRAFREFGVISAIGGLLVVAAYTICLPPLLRWFPAPRPAAPSERSLFHRYATWVAHRRIAVLAVSTALGLLIALQIPNLEFDYDFAALDGMSGRASQLDPEIDAVLGRQQASLAILTKDEADAQAAAVTLRARRRPAGEPGPSTSIDFVITTRDLIPEHQADKREILARIQSEIQNIDPERLAAKEQGAFRQLERAVRAQPFAAADLPESVIKELALDAEDPGGLVLVFPSVKMSDGEAILQLAQELRDVSLPSGDSVTGTGEAMVLADVLTLIFHETPRILAVTVALVFLCLLLFLFSFEKALLSYAPALVSVAVTLGAAPLLGFEMNYLNIVFIPVLFGMAVDSGVHLVTRTARSQAEWIDAVAETGRAVFGAALTTGAGFGALCLAHHPGLNSLGRLALLGVGISLLASLVWLAAALLVWGDRSAKPA